MNSGTLLQVRRLSAACSLNCFFFCGRVDKCHHSVRNCCLGFSGRVKIAARGYCSNSKNVFSLAYTLLSTPLLCRVGL
jgi:hypothetical protein